MSNSYIAYFRVSTQRQGLSGLGLEAQRTSVEGFCKSDGGDVLEKFIEIESGKRSDRPKLNAAISACKKFGAILLIAKLDRLARNVHFISGLLESEVKFIAVDMPNADRFMMHVYAAMAEEEARKISERTKLALAAAKRRGVQLGQNGKVLARKNRDAANSFADKAGPAIDQLRKVHSMTFRAIADHLNSTKELATVRGGAWHETTVYRLHTRYLKNVSSQLSL